MKSDDTKKQIEDLQEVLKKQKEIENINEFAQKTSFIVRTLFESFRNDGFQHEEALELTKIWCVKNFGR